MTDGKERDINPDIPHPVEKENDAKKEEQMIVTGDHMLGAKINKR